MMRMRSPIAMNTRDLPEEFRPNTAADVSTRESVPGQVTELSGCSSPESFTRLSTASSRKGP